MGLLNRICGCYWAPEALNRLVRQAFPLLIGALHSGPKSLKGSSESSAGLLALFQGGLIQPAMAASVHPRAGGSRVERSIFSAERVPLRRLLADATGRCNPVVVTFLPTDSVEEPKLDSSPFPVRASSLPRGGRSKGLPFHPPTTSSKNRGVERAQFVCSWRLSR